jgi:murein DD-endopeptidase MepM/ murein hydrolase activator NlpD
VIIEHRIPGEGTYFSIYGHLHDTWISEGDAVAPGQMIGTVGMSGRTTAPHLHLQIDRDTGLRPHARYWPSAMPTKMEAERYTVHPMQFMAEHAALSDVATEEPRARIP